MQIQLGSRIDSLRRKKNISVEEIAEAIGTTTRNVYALFKKNDIAISQLWLLSEKLGYNFFKLYQPDVGNEEIEPEEMTRSTIGKKYHTSYFEVRYPTEKVGELGRFMGNVHAIADEVGFEVV
ncbi:MAG: helix-turn-helix transcriptional regulator [Sphingobacteriaceae bacterium]